MYVFRRTVGGTLGGRSLAATAANADAVDDIALLGLVSQAAGLVGAGRTGSTVADVELTKLYYALSAKVQRVYSTGGEDMILVTRRKFCFPPPTMGIQRTSQQRTRRRKSIISLCFFF